MNSAIEARPLHRRKSPIGQIFLNLFFILLCLCYVLPMLLVISISFEGNSSQFFSLVPRDFTLDAYRLVFARPQKILNAYGVTAFSAIVGTLGSLAVMMMFAYALSKRDFKYRGFFTFLLFFTTLFSGGMVPSYLVNTQLLHLGNKIWIYILPGLINAWNVIVIRTFFQGLPNELYEAAHLDGASELRICFQIVLPLSTPALASVGFLGFIDRWNNWSTAQVYIRNPDLYSMQYLLKIILDSEETLKQLAEAGQVSTGDADKQLSNLESMRFAMAVVAAGPMCFVFPFFQKYFAKGLTLGSVKG